MYNLLYKQHDNSNSLDRVLNYVMRGDEFFYLHLRNSFTWHCNLLLLESIPNVPLGIILSDADNVIPVNQIATYIQSVLPKQPVTILKSCDHGGFSIDSEQREIVLKQIANVIVD